MLMGSVHVEVEDNFKEVAKREIMAGRSILI
jgi:hypothetical protein